MLKLESSAGSPRWDAMVVGGGPAGTSTAIVLARRGWRVALLERRPTVAFKLGETIPPAAIHLVEEFVDRDQLDRVAERTFGNASRWAGDRVDTSDFAMSVAGHGLCLDRAAFDQALRRSAASVGVACLEGWHLHRVCRQQLDSGWDVALVHQGVELHHQCRYVVDASGRHAVVARALGEQRLSRDGLFAYTQRFTTNATDDDSSTQIEAADAGWWYTTRLPAHEAKGSHRVVVFHTDRDLADGKQASRSHGHYELLSKTVEISKIVANYGYVQNGRVRGGAANSERLRRCAGDGWLAVGDAALAFDPLSSQGILKALTSGAHAGQLLGYALEDEEQGAPDDVISQYLVRYARKQDEAWARYCIELSYFYQCQRKWADSLFWRRRNRPRRRPRTIVMQRYAS